MLPVYAVQIGTVIVFYYTHTTTMSSENKWEDISQASQLPPSDKYAVWILSLTVNESVLTISDERANVETTPPCLCFTIPSFPPQDISYTLGKVSAIIDLHSIWLKRF